ncbi:MAG: NAD(P)/FAD-dependent oxidoreductase, partial [Bacteroidetes bacterium]
SHLPGLEFPADYPTYVPRQKVVEYFEAYARHFDIRPRFNETVVAIEKTGDGWAVKTASGKGFYVENVVLATGVNRVENIPRWSGDESFRGVIMHSRKYKNPKPFAGQKVLVIGMGNTGAEVALDLSLNGAETYISVRGPVSIVPRDVNGRPVQLTARAMSKLPFGLGDWIGTQIRKRVIGDLSKYGLKTDPTPPTVLLRKTGKTPVIDIGTVAQIKAGKIRVLPEVKRFFASEIEFMDGQKLPFDTVILATGYRARLQDFVPDLEGFLDKNGLPKQPVGTGKWDGLFFVGFDNYKLGGILGTIYNDSATVTQHIRARQTAESSV